METGVSTAANTLGYVVTGFKAFILVVAVYVIYKLVSKFQSSFTGLFGSSKDTEEAKLLSTDKVFADAATNVTTNPKNEFLIAIKKKFGAKPTDAQMKTLLPNYASMPKWVTDIRYEAKNTWSSDDSAKVFSIFRLMRSQWEINFFATMFNITTKKDIYLWLEDIMYKGELNDLRKMINTKPII